MKSLIVMVSTFTLYLSASTWAAEHIHSHTDSAVQNNTTLIQTNHCSNNITVDINGLVCDFCARALEKVFGKRDEVSAIDVDLDHAKVRIDLVEGKSLDDATLSQLIKDAGYDIVAIHKGCQS